MRFWSAIIWWRRLVISSFWLEHSSVFSPSSRANWSNCWWRSSGKYRNNCARTFYCYNIFAIFASVGARHDNPLLRFRYVQLQNFNDMVMSQMSSHQTINIYFIPVLFFFMETKTVIFYNLRVHVKGKWHLCLLDSRSQLMSIFTNRKQRDVNWPI